MITLGFIIQNFTFRGTGHCLFDYAFYNQKILNNKSIILSPKKRKEDYKLMIDKFKDNFQIILFDTPKDIKQICIDNNISAVYILKYGLKDEYVNLGVFTINHCVFTTEDEHGDIYAAISESVNGTNHYPIVKHMVELPDTNNNYRKLLNIPDDAIVFGRHGGIDTFDIPFVKHAMLEVLKENDNIYFLFAIRPNMLKDIEHPRIIYFEPFVDPIIKRQWVNTLDGFLHASSIGESFGISVLEASFCGKPVITCESKIYNQHLINLGDKSIKYTNEKSLKYILLNFKTIIKDRDFYIRSFTPEKIMKSFDQEFIQKIKIKTINK